MQESQPKCWAGVVAEAQKAAKKKEKQQQQQQKTEAKQKPEEIHSHTHIHVHKHVKSYAKYVVTKPAYPTRQTQTIRNIYETKMKLRFN